MEKRQTFVTKFLFLRGKKQNLENSHKICIFDNIRFILGDFRSNACYYFLHFCICLANFVFFCDRGPLTNATRPYTWLSQSHAVGQGQ